MDAFTKDKILSSILPVGYPDYSREEKIADGIVHFAGVLASIIAFSILLSHPMLNAQISPALGVYAFCVIALFFSSTAYHMTPWTQYRPILRRLDQSAIYFKIAGTYTPLVVIIGSTFAYTLLAMVWTAATIGAAAKLVTGDRLDKYTIIIYLGLGWSAILLLWPLAQTLPLIIVWLVLVGGALYTIGIYFHQALHIKYSNAIWHAFVLAASACHFVAVANAAML